MASLAVQDRLNKLREERLAREKARIEKLRDLNLKKYSKTELPMPKQIAASTSKSDIHKLPATKNHVNGNKNTNNKNQAQANVFKRPTSVPVPAERKSFVNFNTKRISAVNATTKTINKHVTVKSERITITDKVNITAHSNLTAKSNDVKLPQKSSLYKIDENERNNQKVFTVVKAAEAATDLSKKTSQIDRNINTLPLPKNVKKDYIASNKIIAKKNNSETSVRKSVAPAAEALKKPLLTRKSLQPPKVSQSASKIDPKRQSVFERLYQPKIFKKEPKLTEKSVSDLEKLKMDPDHLKKVIRNAGLLLNGSNMKKDMSVRRSISAVHLKRISKNELTNCIHKWSSVGEKLNKAHLKDEDAAINEDKIVLAVRSERKHVKFMTPLSNLNTPKPEELQAKLKSWLQKRGKSIDSYHHLQCFGIHHLARESKMMDVVPPKFDDEDEDKENVPVESDSDNESFHDVMNDDAETVENDKKKVFEANKWRRASCVSSVSGELNESQDTTLTYSESPHVDDVVMGALHDLTELLREGYSWEQCARWLRAIRERLPAASQTAAYWECRAELEARRGDLPASAHCWHEAHAHSAASQLADGDFSALEQNLDQLLDKFMQLKISPRAGGRPADDKLVDMRNVFKSTLIKFAVQQAKRRSEEKLIVTPVRRSGRLSSALRTPQFKYAGQKPPRTPLIECDSLREAETMHPIHFVPNQKLPQTP